MRRVLTLMLAGGLVAGSLIACDGLGVAGPGNSPSANVVPSGITSDDGARAAKIDVKTIQALLDSLAVKGRAAKTGYSRAAFGQTWADVDRNGCDTRNDILNRDLTGKTYKPKTRECVVLTGILDDPYSGAQIDFTRGQSTSAKVQIDHVVALSNAWQTGAAYFDENERQQFANDPLELLAVAGSVNESKGDGDAATWLPPAKTYRCAYVAKQVAVKAKYKLWVTKPEKAAMERILKAC